VKLIGALIVDLAMVSAFSTWGLSFVEMVLLGAMLFPFIAAGLSE